MTTMFVRHTVANYAAWRRAYDAFAPVHASVAFTGDSVVLAAGSVLAKARAQQGKLMPAIPWKRVGQWHYISA